MKNHVMRLTPVPMKKIRSGVKTIELRLFDEKRRAVSVGDRITFVNTENAADTLTVKVENLYVFASFDELYQNLPLLSCGYTEDEVDTASPRDMDAYYSKEKQAQYGVVGIEISVLLP